MPEEIEPKKQDGSGTTPQMQDQPQVQAQAQAPASYSLDNKINPDNGSQQPKLNLLQKLLSKPASNGDSNGDSNGSGNIFTNLFGKQKDVPSQPITQAAKAPSLSQLLGPKPVFSPRVFEETERRIKKTAKAVFNIAVLFALAVFGFFYTQLNPDFTLLDAQFGPNTAVRFNSSNSEIQKLQTDLNVVRYRFVRSYLDEINNNVDSLKNAQKILAAPLGIDTYSPQPVTVEDREQLYEKLLVDELSKQKTALAGMQKPNKDEIAVIDNVLKLVQNKTFRTMLVSRDLDKISKDDFAVLLTKIREEGMDELSSIDRLQKQRLDWGQVISDIHNVVRKVDEYYGQGLFKTIGGLSFSAYNFDASSGRISISGFTKTADSKTFSFIARLVDAIEKSLKFKDIDFRTFSKSRDDKGDFSSTLNLEFALQNGFDPRDEILELNGLQQ